MNSTTKGSLVQEQITLKLVLIVNQSKKTEGVFTQQLCSLAIHLLKILIFENSFQSAHA